MKVIEFEVAHEAFETGKQELADIIKSWIWGHEPEWLERLNFEDDHIFTEPSLFYFFRTLTLGKPAAMTLAQILWGYHDEANRPAHIEAISDADGVIYLPQVGYVHTHLPGLQSFDLQWVDEKTVEVSGKVHPVQGLRYVQDGNFLLLDYKPGIYTEKAIQFLEPIADSTQITVPQLESVLKLLEHKMPDFYAAIKASTREYGIFNSANFESFTALHHFGSAFLNLAGQKQSEVFFLDDVAHQSGHVMYYTLTHNFARFLKPNRYTLLRDFTNVASDDRSVYGAFHGLFTYTSILHTLHRSIQEQWFKKDPLLEQEALARLGFYFGKFELDLSFQGDSRVLTDEGWRYYDMFYAGFGRLKREYQHLVRSMDYSNQDYNFSLEKFQQINQLQPA